MFSLGIAAEGGRPHAQYSGSRKFHTFLPTFTRDTASSIEETLQHIPIQIP